MSYHDCFVIFFFGFQVLAKKFGAAVVSLEHRYYGKSSPFKSHTTENLKYLSSKQALFDLAVFRQRYQVNFFFPLFSLFRDFSIPNLPSFVLVGL